MFFVEVSFVRGSFDKSFSSKFALKVVFFVKKGVFRLSLLFVYIFDEKHFLTKNTFLTNGSIFLILFVNSFVRQILLKSFNKTLTNDTFDELLTNSHHLNLLEKQCGIEEEGISLLECSKNILCTYLRHILVRHMSA